MGFLENLTNDAFANKMAEHYQSQTFPPALSIPHPTDGLSPKKKADYFHTHLPGKGEFKNLRLEATSGKNPRTPLWLAQPFIQRGIQGENLINFEKLNFITAPIQDTERVTKFMGSPNGLLFIAKQVGLQMSNPKGEFLAPGPINAGRIYNPLATIAQIPAGALGIHVDRHALGPLNPEAINYEKRIKAKTLLGQNRLVGIANQLNVGHFRKLTLAPSETEDAASDKTFIQKVADKIKNTNWYINRSKTINAMSGWGGPNSLFGIGFTTHRTSKPQRIDGEVIAKYQPPNGTNLPVGDPGPGSYTAKLPEGAYKEFSEKSDTITNMGLDVGLPTITPAKSDVDREQLAKYQTLSYGGIARARKDISTNTSIKSFKDGSRYELSSYSRLGLIDYGNAAADALDDTYGETGGGTSDYCTLKLASDTKEILLRSYGLGTITDNTSFNWSEVKYAGRTMAQYKFGDVSRDVSHDLIIVAFTKGELKQNMAKLNKLYQIASPSVNSGSGLASAPLVQLTLGDLYTNQNVVIDKITFTVEEGTPWDINFGDDGVAELPMMVKLNLGYKLITNAGGGFFTNSSTYWNPVT